MVLVRDYSGWHDWKTLTKKQKRAVSHFTPPPTHISKQCRSFFLQLYQKAGPKSAYRKKKGGKREVGDSVGSSRRRRRRRKGFGLLKSFKRAKKAVTRTVQKVKKKVGKFAVNKIVAFIFVFLPKSWQFFKPHLRALLRDLQELKSVAKVFNALSPDRKHAM